MPARGTKLGDGPTKPQAFAVFAGKRGQVGVRIAGKRAYASAAEAIISASPVRITVVDGALRITGEGVVRQHKRTIAVTA